MKLFVWDYHGVMEKGNENTVTEISNLALEKLGYSQRLTDEDCQKLYGAKWYKYFEFLLPKEPYEIHLELQSLAFEISHEESIIRKHIQPNDHIHFVLKEIGKKHQQIVISNTLPKSLQIYLDVINITSFFPETHAFGANAHFKDTKRTKIDILKNFLIGKKFDDIIFIGDSFKDIELVSVAGGKAYLYSHPGKPFREANLPDCQINRIRDLREILKEI